MSDAERTTPAPASATPAPDQWLPIRCPAWCRQVHLDMLEEGCDLEAAQAHRGQQLGGYLDEHLNPIDRRVTRPGGGEWFLEVIQHPLRGGGFRTQPVVLFETIQDNHVLGELHLGSGDARVLARQLLVLADALDLE